MGYADVILADAPVAYWRLGEATGQQTAVDASGHGHHGTYTGSPTLAVGGLVDGNDTAVQFPGNSGWVSLPIGAVNSALAGDAWTIGLRTVITSHGGLLCGPRANAGARLFGPEPDWVGSGFIVFAEENVKVITSSAIPYSIGSRHYIVYTYQRPTIIGYVDGLPIATTSHAFGTNPAVAYTINSSAGLAGQGAPATEDEVELYDIALSAAQIAAHYAAGFQWGDFRIGTADPLVRAVDAVMVQGGAG